MHRELLPRLRQLISLQNRELMYPFLSKGYADAIASHETSMLQYIADYDVELRILDEPLLTVGLVVAFDLRDERGLDEQLNAVLADATARVQPPTDKGRRLKIYYMTQAGTKPPHFVIFCNDARLFHFSYQRYLENQIREVFGLQGTPIRITIRQKGDKEE